MYNEQDNRSDFEIEIASKYYRAKSNFKTNKDSLELIRNNYFIFKSGMGLNN